MLSESRICVEVLCKPFVFDVCQPSWGGGLCILFIRPAQSWKSLLFFVFFHIPVLLPFLFLVLFVMCVFFEDALRIQVFQAVERFESGQETPQSLLDSVISSPGGWGHSLLQLKEVNKKKTSEISEDVWKWWNSMCLHTIVVFFSLHPTAPHSAV